MTRILTLLAGLCLTVGLAGGCKHDDQMSKESTKTPPTVETADMTDDACPMCPGKQVATADGKCPICGMKVAHKMAGSPTTQQIHDHTSPASMPSTDGKPS